jgi:biopolymer transport protein ExbD
MVTTKISKDKIKLEINLPVATSAVIPDDLTNRDIINIDGSGAYFLGDERVTKEALTSYLVQRFKDYPPLRLYVRADQDTPARQIKELMRLSAEAGAIDVIFGSYPTER